MNGWMKGGPSSKRWHQVEYDTYAGTAVLLCDPQGVVVVERDESVMDYRWRPPVDQWCRHPQCRAEVLP